MFRINKIEDGILLVLIVFIIGASIFLLLGDGVFRSEDSIEIRSSIEKENSNIKDVEEKRSTLPKEVAKEILVHIGGEVDNPGVYRLKEGDRLYQLVEKAGGPTAKANLDLINLVDEVRDGGKVIIPSQGGGSSGDALGLVNINSATANELETLSGVGPATAGRIIDYRNKVGGFDSLEDLMEVSGIGERTYDRLKDQITY
ncbi:helix-hairpin-helix domain-containing protein [Halonatronum saccharophilum]|uniref:helix-hairpin-helix domain-containing protein n=1 Tax=Halonatronum saccharophilum TaxID=150060 RepID=UPI0004B74E81|nr:helix-hairpin-helix domain-containing protein [Halonatronum saccharophilum]